MSIPLIEVTRGSLTECIHRGDIAVTDSTGKLLFSCGDATKVSYMRSAAKPLQALNIITSGSAERFKLTSREIAIACSSHYGEDFHRAAVLSILKKAGLTRDDLQGGIVPSLNPQYALEVAGAGIELDQLFSDCSGKQAGMLAVCSHKGYDTDSYLNPTHPCQQEILQLLAEMTDLDISDIPVGIDGCSAPVHAMPLSAMARSFARLANPRNLKPETRSGAEVIYNAMVEHPEMISGTGGFCTQLIAHCNCRLIGKIGAEGVYCVGVRGRDLGFAIKIESGNMSVLPAVVMEILEQLNFVGEDEKLALSSYIRPANTNDVQATVGRIRPVFTLAPAPHD